MPDFVSPTYATPPVKGSVNWIKYAAIAVLVLDALVFAYWVVAGIIISCYSPTHRTLLVEHVIGFFHFAALLVMWAVYRTYNTVRSVAGEQQTAGTPAPHWVATEPYPWAYIAPAWGSVLTDAFMMITFIITWPNLDWLEYMECAFCIAALFMACVANTVSIAVVIYTTYWAKQLKYAHQD